MSKQHVLPVASHRTRHNWWWWTIAAVVTLFAVLAILAVSLWQATRYVPAFYAKRVAPPTVDDRTAGDEFERRVLELKNQVRHEGGWQTVLTEDQINGWLAVHLEEKFPESLPATIKAPRVLLEPGKASLAARFTQSGVESVITVNISAFLTDRPNEVALQLRGVQAGLVPVPMKQIIDQAQQEAAHKNIPLRWEQRDGNPVAILQIPAQDRDFDGRSLRVETIEIRSGELVLAGRMEK